jgi:pimeloyl-ACP methyl ester carboxylesterase
MRFASRAPRLLAVLPGLAVAALLAGGALAQTEDKTARGKDKADTSRRVKFNSYDGVELSGTFYPKPTGGKDKDACVLLLHNFDRIKGGSSHQDGWDRLAEELQREGFAVLSFDFRGFGESKTVSREMFWDRTKSPQNRILRGAARMAETIDFKEFPAGYYPYLVNDIAAAKAYLDRKNDAREVNTSNLILVGAGEGANLGSLWLAGDCKLKRARGYLPDGRLDLDEPECRDVACALWLSINPRLAGMATPVTSWLREAGGEYRIPIGFLYGADDREGRDLANSYVSSIHAANRRGKQDFTAAAEVRDTKLRGSQLLTKSLKTEQMIKDYLERVMEKRGAREARSRDPQKTTFVWASRQGQPVWAKTDKDELLKPLPLGMMGIQGP